MSTLDSTHHTTVSIGDIRMADPEGPYVELLQQLEAAADGTLRLAFQYDPESVTIAFLREDLLSEDLLPRIEELHSRVKIAETTPTGHHGDLETAISVHEDVFVVQFFGTDGDGLVAVTDREDGSFVQEVL